MSTENYFKLLAVFATDRSNAMVLVLSLFCVALWFLIRQYGAFHVKSYLALCCHVFNHVKHCDHLSWERENLFIYAPRAFVCLSKVSVFFSLPLSVKV